MTRFLPRPCTGGFRSGRIMKSCEEKLVVIDDCGSEVIDIIMATVNYELSGEGSIFLHTEDLAESNNDHVQEILRYLNDPTRDDAGPVSIPYEGLVLLRS